MLLFTFRILLCKCSFSRNIALAYIISAIILQIKEKRLILPALCGCPHGLSPISLQYPNACAINCPLYQNAALHGKLLQNLLQSYDL